MEEKPIWGRLFDRAREQLDAGMLSESEATWLDLLALDNWDDLERWGPGWASDTWFNLGLVYKRTRRWPDCLRCNLRATELDPESEGAWWNMGIAATAIGEWSAARRAWRGYGLDVPGGDGPVEMSLGLVPIRLNPHGNGEVVWCRRIDPARAIIENVPLPESGYRWRDCLLHDGEPAGERLREGQRVPVFNVLERLQSSGVPTLRATVSGADERDFDELRGLFDEHGWAVEDWSGTLRRLSAEESEGQAPAYRDSPDVSHTRLVGIAAPPDQAQQLLGVWLRDGPNRSCAGVEEAG